MSHHLASVEHRMKGWYPITLTTDPTDSIDPKSIHKTTDINKDDNTSIGNNIYVTNGGDKSVQGNIDIDNDDDNDNDKNDNKTSHNNTETIPDFDPAKFEQEFVLNAYSSIAHAYIDRRQHEWDCTVEFLANLALTSSSKSNETNVTTCINTDINTNTNTSKNLAAIVLDVGVGSGKYFRTVDAINSELRKSKKIFQI